MKKKNKKQYDVFCIGSAGRDIFLPIPSEAQAENAGSLLCFGHGMKIHIEDRYEAIGGGACNVAVALSRLGCHTAVHGVVGDDGDGSWIHDILTKEGVDTAYIQEREGATDLSCIVVEATSGERTILVNRDVGEYMDLSANVIPQARWIYLTSFYGDDAAVTKNMQIMHDHCTVQDSSIAYNPGMTNIERHAQRVCDLIHHTTCLFINREEALKIVFASNSQYNKEEFSDVQNIFVALHKIMQRGSIIVMTDGKNGAWASSEEDIVHITATAQKAVDTTGAGDTFASGFLAAHMRGLSIRDALLWGACNSRSVIKKYGAQEGALDVKAVEGCVADLNNEFTVTYV